jgi:hypothetical protein
MLSLLSYSVMKNEQKNILSMNRRKQNFPNKITQSLLRKETPFGKKEY